MSAPSEQRVPNPGQLVTVRQRRFVVSGVRTQALPTQRKPLQHLVELRAVDDGFEAEELTVVWELELGRMVFEADRFPSPPTILEQRGAFDDPRKLDAFLHSVEWSAVASADIESLHAPFRSGITIEDYQLDPVARAVAMPRASLLIADDVGLGKTIEAGLVVQELALRHRARTALVVCPAGLQIQWRDQMRDRFGLEFRIIDSEAMRELRRRRGLGVNPWTHFPRLITSIDFLKRDRPMRLFREVLPAPGESTFPRRFDILIVDEAHNVAPAGRGLYAIDSSDRTEAVRTLAPHFEHKLFLSATPHNGYSESFTALLELLDDQRFCRGVMPSQAQLGAVMIRRLKRELPPDDLGNPRFPERVLEALPVSFQPEERAAHAELERYAALLRARADAGGASGVASEFVTKLLKKRLFSSPEAFKLTLEKHRRSVTQLRKGESASRRPAAGILRREIEGYEEEDQLEEDEDAVLGLLDATGEALPQVSEEELALLDSLSTWADRASGGTDSKAEKLLQFLEQTVRPGGRWGDTRVIIFTEYRATQNWLLSLLATRGFSEDGRVVTLHGGMETELREAVKAAFQASPRDSTARILLATDAASEGIDLQNHCSRLIHYEIPWNPMRMEQRNGRVDRHGQRAPKVSVYHFVGEGWEAGAVGREPGSLEGDLEFLLRAARKVDQVREDLGNVGDVIASEVEEAMLGKRKRLDVDTNAPRARAAREALKLERDLRAHVEKLRRDLFASRDQLGIGPDALRRLVDVGLELAGHPPLREVRVDAGDTGSVRAYEVPALAGTWAPCLDGLRHPHTHAMRPIVFDHEVAKNRDDVVLGHLGHKLVDMCLSLLRSELWTPTSERKLARVTARVVPGSELDHPMLAAHARLVLLGADGAKLHEELLLVGGAIEGGALVPVDPKRLRSVLQVAERTEARVPAKQVLTRLAQLWSDHEAVLTKELDRARRVRAKHLRTLLEKRKKREKEHVEAVLRELLASLERRRAEGDMPQLELFSSRERDQYDRNQDAIRSRIETIPADIEREVGAIEARYVDPSERVFPVAITYLVPSSLAAAGR